MEELNEQSKLRKYILNDISDEARLAIEERLLTDDEYFEAVSMAEETLIQDYADGNLDGKERERFENCFLSSGENRQKVKFSRALRKYVNETESALETEKKPGFFSSLKAFFSAPVPAALAVLVISGIVGFFVWKNYSKDSEVLVALNKAYKNERPIESRISDFDYAPIRTTRGNESANIDQAQLELAKLIALTAVTKNPSSAENLHALGQVYLAEKNFKSAVEQFEKAVKIAPKDAGLHNDLGVAYLESEKSNNEKNFEVLVRANEEFGKAIELDKSLTEAYFNRALSFQLLSLSEQAKEAWKEYLKLDSSSPWAAEAQKNLQNLEQQKSQNISADELEKKFIDYCHQKKDTEAWQLLSRNRSLMEKKYLPQKLAVSYLGASENDKKDLLKAMVFAAGLEKKFAGDSFASDLVNYYANLPKDKIELLKSAHNSLQTGFDLRFKANLTQAVVEFEKAKNLFLQAGDIWESKLSEHCIAYCFYYSKLRTNSSEIWENLKDFSEKKNYKWLELTTSRWLAGYTFYLEKYTEAQAKYKKAILFAENINDTFALREILTASIEVKLFLGQTQDAFSLAEKLWTLSNTVENTADQKWRIYQKVFDVLISFKLLQTAKTFALELVRLANEAQNSTNISYASKCLSIAFLQNEDFSEAQKWNTDRLQKIEMIQEPLLRNRHLADNYLELANIERVSGAVENSIYHYNQVIQYSEEYDLPINLYQAQKGKLLSYLALNNQANIEEQIPIVLELTEKYRDKILEEQQRNNFFDSAQNVYDIGTDFEFRRNNFEQAYNYTEKSNSRSLLDWLKRGAKISEDKNNLEILFDEKSTPLNLQEIQARIPDKVQILQYSVLDDKVIIWLISKDKFLAVSSEIKSKELSQKVEDYIKAILKLEETEQLSQEIYKLLISPIIDQLDRTKEICLIPQKFLFNLPFAALSSPENKSFLEEFNFFYAPSANIFLICTEEAQKKSEIKDETLLSVGNPTFDRQTFPDLADLATAETEAKDITGFYKSHRALLKNEATKSAFLSHIKEANIIHFAGHYLVIQGVPLSSSLILAKNTENAQEENVLTNSELISEKLPNAKLVILSACQTGIENYYKGEGLIGLSRTFLAVGVPLVVASQWKADSEPTAELMKKFHFYRRQEGFSTVEALRKAQIDLSKSANKIYRHPYYWAAFAAFGGYAQF